MHTQASTTITIRPLAGIGEVARGCDLGALLAEALMERIVSVLSDDPAIARLRAPHG